MSGLLYSYDFGLGGPHLVYGAPPFNEATNEVRKENKSLILREKKVWQQLITEYIHSTKLCDVMRERGKAFQGLD